MEDRLLNGKRILIVDDEPDVLETLSELLAMCDVVKAKKFEEARELLETEYFDIAVLDIMGVKGYELLEVAHKKKMLVVMLTANALTVDNTVKSFKKGAVSYIPKEKMSDIETFLEDILEEEKKGKSFVERWLMRFNSYYEKKFGSDWKKDDKEFWEEYGYWV